MNASRPAGALPRQDAGTPPGARALGLIVKGLSAHAIYFIFVIAYFMVLKVVVAVAPDARESSFYLIASAFIGLPLPIMVFGLFLHQFWQAAFVRRSASPTKDILAGMWAFISNPARLVNGIVATLALIIFMRTYMDLKSNIPILTLFSWDGTFDRLDQTLHFGVRPWELLHPVFGNAAGAFLLNLNYTIWFLVMWTVWVFMAFQDANREVRTRFLIAFMLTWSVGGSAMAYYFSSAGPCFFGRLGFSPDPYAALLQQLRDVDAIVPVWSVGVQDLLWKGYLGQGQIDGISAMPSMHNSSALLFALAVWRVSRGGGIVLAIHAVFILLGSIYLAWHYAVDAYAGWAVTLVFWWLSAPLAKWWHGRPEMAAFDAGIAALRREGVTA